MIDERTILEMIVQGEGQHIEFKESIPSKVRELSEEVCAFSNASGGVILIGINNKEKKTGKKTVKKTQERILEILGETSK